MLCKIALLAACVLAVSASHKSTSRDKEWAQLMTNPSYVKSRCSQLVQPTTRYLRTTKTAQAASDTVVTQTVTRAQKNHTVLVHPDGPKDTLTSTVLLSIDTTASGKTSTTTVWTLVQTPYATKTVTVTAAKTSSATGSGPESGSGSADEQIAPKLAAVIQNNNTADTEDDGSEETEGTETEDAGSEPDENSAELEDNNPEPDDDEEELEKRDTPSRALLSLIFQELSDDQPKFLKERCKSLLHPTVTRFQIITVSPKAHTSTHRVTITEPGQNVTKTVQNPKAQYGTTVYTTETPYCSALHGYCRAAQDTTRTVLQFSFASPTATETETVYARR